MVASRNHAVATGKIVPGFTWSKVISQTKSSQALEIGVMPDIPALPTQKIWSKKSLTDPCGEKTS